MIKVGAIYLILIFYVFGYGQPISIKKELLIALDDSIHIPTPSFVKLLYTARIIGFNDSFIVLNRNKTHLIFDKYNYQGSKILSKMYETDTTHFVLISYVKGELLFGYSEDYTFLNILDKNLNIVQTIPVPLEQFENEKYTANFYGFYDIKGIIYDDFIVFPVSYVYNGQKYYKKYKKWEYMLGIYKIKSNKLQPHVLVGKVDTNLKEQNAYFLYDYPKSTINPLNKVILFCSEASDHIQEWKIDSSSKKFISFGKRGKYMQTTAIKLQKTKELFNKHFSNYFHYRIENDLYQDLYYDSTNKLVFRTYRPAIKDTIYKRSEFQKNTTNHNTQMQIRLEHSKKYGLQIYNEKYELIFDEVMPTPFNILKIENNEIWVHGKYDENTQKYWIYKYTITLPKP